MRELNRKFLKRNYPTDVLAFRLEVDFGEIYIAANQIKNYHHMIELVLHGLLHLAGYNHRTSGEEKIMIAKMSKYLAKFG